MPSKKYNDGPVFENPISSELDSFETASKSSGLSPGPRGGSQSPSVRGMAPVGDRSNLLKKTLDSTVYQAFSVFITIWSLVFDDVRVLAAPKSADPTLGYVTLTIAGVFCFEIVANFVAGRDYGAYRTCGSKLTGARRLLMCSARTPARSLERLTTRRVA